MRRSSALILLVVLLVAGRAWANDDFTRVVKEALASAEPTTAVLRGLASLPDFTMDGPSVARALTDAGAEPEGQVAQVLGDVVSVRKKGDKVTIRRNSERLIPITIKGETKGWVKVGKEVEIRLRARAGEVVLDDFEGLKIGEEKDELYGLKEISWKPGAQTSRLTITAGWGIFTRTSEHEIPNTSAPSRTPGFAGRLGAG